MPLIAEDDKAKKGETAEQKAKRRKKQPCYAFKHTGACVDGKKCQYSHVVGSVSSDSEESSNHVSCTTEIGLWGGRVMPSSP